MRNSSACLALCALLALNRAPAHAQPATASIVGGSAACEPACAHGSCQLLSNGTSFCNCKLSGHVGPACSIEKDNSSSWTLASNRLCNPSCANGGSCSQLTLNGQHAFYCECSGVPYTGNDCSIPDNPDATPPTSPPVPGLAGTAAEVAGSSSLSGGAAAGVVIGALVAVAAAVAIIMWARRRPNTRFSRFGDSQDTELPSHASSASV